MKHGKIIIITAPSGSGKTTLVKRLLTAFPELSFSISACTRNPRTGEEDGKDYYFLTVDRFKQLIEEEAFIEYEMVYEGKYYGTLKKEITRMWNENKVPLIDIDVQGAMNVQKQYQDTALSIFIKAPSIEELRRRLETRGTESPETLEERVAKAAEELQYAPEFDHVVVNDDLEVAYSQLFDIISKYINA